MTFTINVSIKDSSKQDFDFFRRRAAACGVSAAIMKLIREDNERHIKAAQGVKVT